MQHYAAFHLGLHCLQKYSFRGFPVHKGLRNQIRFYISCGSSVGRFMQNVLPCFRVYKGLNKDKICIHCSIRICIRQHIAVCAKWVMTLCIKITISDMEIFQLSH